VPPTFAFFLIGVADTYGFGAYSYYNLSYLSGTIAELVLA
jgi:hypothetical protein